MRFSTMSISSVVESDNNDSVSRLKPDEDAFDWTARNEGTFQSF
jgi:hypothetical protein